MSSAIRVMLVHKFHKLTGGAEVFYHDVARVLKQNGHVVGFFSTADDNNPVTGDFEAFVDPPSYESGSILARVISSRDIFYSSKNYDAMLQAIDDFSPDVIHAFAINVHLTPSVLKAAKERGIPVVMSCNDYKHICPNYKLFYSGKICEDCKGGRFYKAAANKCCKGSIVYSVASSLEAYIHQRMKVYEELIDLYLFASNFMLEKTKEFWVGKDFRYGILRNPFDSAKYQPEYGGDYALYFGRIIDEKGVNLIVDAARDVKCLIKIVGDGPDLASLQQRVVDEKILNIEFMGARWGADLDEILRKAAFTIVPSLWHENFPYVVFQSFAMGKPVVGSNRGGIPELLGDSRGLIFEPNVEGDLSMKISTLWEHKDLILEMGERAKSYVDMEFSDSLFYRTIMEHYRKVL